LRKNDSEFEKNDSELWKSDSKLENCVTAANAVSNPSTTMKNGF